jgi:hypothetical protein
MVCLFLESNMLEVSRRRFVISAGATGVAFGVNTTFVFVPRAFADAAGDNEASLRTAVVEANLDQASKSVRGLAIEYKLPEEPISLRRLIAPEQIVWTLGPGAAGDVSGGARFGIKSNGFWLLWGKLHDSGDLYGDDFWFGVRFKHAVDNQARYASSSGHIGHQSDYPFKASGLDPWIANNWEGIKSEGVEWTLKATPAPSPWVAFGLGVAGVVLIPLLGGLGGGSGGGEYHCKPYGEPGGEAGGGEVGVDCKKEF